ncbi:cytochrome P450 [Aspergillus egyptiacus]|nr:cytochrome P450 [Aspergillus egyptiacus]
MLVYAALLALLAYAIIVHPVVVYLRDKNNLRQFPSPSYAGISALWRITKIVRNTHFQAVYDAHQRYGSHIRIAPNQVSVSDPVAMNDIYGHGAGFSKDAFYDAGAGPYRSMADTRNKEEHQRKRKMLAHAFAQKTIVHLEPVVRTGLRALVDQFDRHASTGKEMNIRRFLNYFTIDFMGLALFGEALGCVESGNDMVNAQGADGTVYKAPFLKSLHDMHMHAVIMGAEPSFIPISSKLLSFHPGVKATRNWGSIVNYLCQKRLQARSDRRDPAQQDIFSKLLQNNKGEELNLPLGEILIECSVMMNAGSETNAAVLVSAIYHIYRHPRVLQKLRQEIDAAAPRENGDGDGIALDIPSYQQIATLPYLRACIDEAMRIRPASTIGFPRVVPKGGRVVAGRFINEGVTVSVPTYTLLQNPSAFENPFEYIPERWLTGDRSKMQASFYHFSHGPRACIGRNISYFEQMLAVATVVRLFDLDLRGDGYETLERLNGNPGELFATVRRR